MSIIRIAFNIAFNALTVWNYKYGEKITSQRRKHDREMVEGGFLSEGLSRDKGQHTRSGCEEVENQHVEVTPDNGSNLLACARNSHGILDAVPVITRT